MLLKDQGSDLGTEAGSGNFSSKLKKESRNTSKTYTIYSSRKIFELNSMVNNIAIRTLLLLRVYTWLHRGSLQTIAYI